MSKNFSNRILTSLVLLVIFFFFLFSHKILWTYLLITAAILSFFEFNNLITKKIKEKSKILIYNIFTFLYLSIFVYVGYYIYSTPPTGLLFVLLICIFSDTGGYVIGKLIGGRKLTSISPNKTVSGSIGSFLFSIFPVFIYLIIYNQTGNLKYYTENLYLLIPTCLFLSLICQLGDLFISYFKRQAKVKDTGSLLPGHGGLLDRVDGIIFVLPAAFIIDKIFY
tara:strand:- start:855 stop:1523 length:669 start_codon:yes stop_codon:yes gene_type:complete